VLGRCEPPRMAPPGERRACFHVGHQSKSRPHTVRVDAAATRL
jgi:hypothetical protein